MGEVKDVGLTRRSGDGGGGAVEIGADFAAQGSAVASGNTSFVVDDGQGSVLHLRVPLELQRRRRLRLLQPWLEARIAEEGSRLPRRGVNYLVLLRSCRSCNIAKQEPRRPRPLPSQAERQVRAGDQLRGQDQPQVQLIRPRAVGHVSI